MICSEKCVVNSIELHETYGSNYFNYPFKNELIPQIVKELPGDLESYFPFPSNLEGNSKSGISRERWTFRLKLPSEFLKETLINASCLTSNMLINYLQSTALSKFDYKYIIFNSTFPITKSIPIWISFKKSIDLKYKISLNEKLQTDIEYFHVWKSKLNCGTTKFKEKAKQSFFGYIEGKQVQKGRPKKKKEKENRANEDRDV